MNCVSEVKVHMGSTLLSGFVTMFNILSQMMSNIYLNPLFWTACIFPKFHDLLGTECFLKSRTIKVGLLKARSRQHALPSSILYCFD